MTAMFHLTYDIVTPESAEDGDTAENGFVHSNGGRDPVEIIDNAEEYRMDLRTALRIAGGFYEDCGSWLSGSPSCEDYSTGADVTYALHPPRNVTPASYGRIKRLLGVR